MEFTGPRARAISIVKFDKKSKKPSLDDAALAGIMDSREEIKDMPTIVISIGGVTRSGKSFLFNLFVNYLTYLEQRRTDEGWETSNTPVEGVNWAQSRIAVTLGIWMWSKPFVIRRSDGTQIAVLLVDTQGTGDNRKGDPNLDTLIMYISLQISSVQVLNVEKYLSLYEMISLTLCADYADVSQTEQSMEGEDDFLFQSLMFVIRDYQSGIEFGEDRMLFESIINECDNDDLRKVVVGIKRAFHSINTYNMPHPGNDIATASENSRKWLIGDIPEQFLVITKSMIRNLCSLEPSKQRLKCWDSGRQLLESFQLLKYHLENDDLPQISSPSEALQETILFKAYTVAQKELLNSINKLLVGEQLQAFETEQDLQRAFDSEAQNAFDMLRKAGRHHKYGQTRIWGKYEGMLNTAMETACIGVKIQYEFLKKFKELEHQTTVVTQKMEKQVEQFHQNVSSLDQQVSQTKMQQVEAEDLYRAREKSMQTLREQLKQAVEEAQNDEVKERQLVVYSQYQEDAEQMRIEYEESKREAAKQLEALSTTRSEYESGYKRDRQQLLEEIERLRKQLREAQEHRRRQEEELKSRSKSSPFRLLLKPIIGAIVGGLVAGIPGAIGGFFGGTFEAFSSFFSKD